jgi:lipopolysaccharide transport system permease protein/teichoic acid transport system permease protein
MASSSKSLFIIECWKARTLLQTMIWRDVKSRFAGSALGLMWAFLQPLCMMGILWFVFTYGLKANPSGSDVSFVAWFFPAQIAWNFAQEGLIMGSGAVTDYSFLVRKVNFKVELLPVVKIGSSLVFHGIFLLLVIVILLLSGVTPQWSWLYVPYFTFAAVVFLVGLSWLTSSLTVLFRDVQQLLGIIAQLGFWGTPIIWRADVLPETMRPWLALNPVYYITEGYRVSFLGPQSGNAWSWDVAPRHGLIFWSFTLVVILLGRSVFKRLRPYFGDIL